MVWQCPLAGIRQRGGQPSEAMEGDKYTYRFTGSLAELEPKSEPPRPNAWGLVVIVVVSLALLTVEFLLQR